MAGETILIIDDNADVRNLLAERVLPSYGYHTLTAPDGQEGLWQIRTQMPDLILLDLRLPDMTGLDLLHILSSEGYDAPVILITAYGSELIAAQALRLGVRDYIIKPFTLDEIIESVERALTEQRLRRERNALTDHVQYCTYALQQLAQVQVEMAEQPDTGLQLRRLLEMAVAAARAHAGQLWLKESAEGELVLRAAQDRPDQRAYLLHRREEAPRIQEALSSGTPLQWPEKAGEAGQLRVAVPVTVDEKPSAVLELHLPKESLLPDDPCMLILRTFADHIGLVLKQATLSRETALLHRQIDALGSLSRDLLLVLDETGAITAASPAIETMLGQRLHDVIGHDFEEWIQTIESQGDMAEWYRQQVSAQRPGEQYSLLFQGRDGATRRAEVQIMLGQEDRGAWRYLLFHDVTAYHRVEQEVRSLRRALGDLVRGAHLGLFLTDLKGTVLAVNGVLTELLQCPQETLLGRPVWDAFSAADAGHLVPEEIARAYREGKGYAEVRWADKEGGMLGITPLLLLGAEGAPHAIVVLAGQSQPPAGKPEDEGDVLGRPGVNSNTRH